MAPSTTKQKNGFSLLEALLAISIFALTITSLLGIIVYGQQASVAAINTERAVMLARQGWEAVRNIRDSDFTNLADGLFGLDSSGGAWQLVGTPDSTDIFLRRVTISTVDASTKQINIEITWPQINRPGTYNLTGYLSFWQEEVVAGWDNPQVLSQTNPSGNNDGLDLAISGSYTYLIRNGGSGEFTVIDTSDPAAPAYVTEITLPDRPEALAVSGSYAYVASRSNSSEVQVVDITNPAAPSLTATLNLSGGSNAIDIGINGSVAMIARLSNSQNATSVDISNPASPQDLDTISLSNRPNALAVCGTYAYYATRDNGAEVEIVDFSDPNNLNSVTTIDLSGNADGQAVMCSGNLLFIGRADTDLHIYDISTPGAPSYISQIALPGQAFSIAHYSADNYLFVGTSDNSQEFVVYDISTPASPTFVSSLNLGGNIWEMIHTPDYVFAASSDNAGELTILAPQ